MNAKVTRMLSALAVVLKNERPALIAAMDRVINDSRDGYPYDFKAQVEAMRCFVQGRSVPE